MTSVPPISTVYVHNLEERVKITHLIETLRLIFSEFGNVLDIVAKRNLKAKGQAFVVFDDSDSAINAIDELQGFLLFGKPLSLSLAKTRSDKTIERACCPEDYESHVKRRLAEKEKRNAAEAAIIEKSSKMGSGPSSDARASKLFKPSGLKSTSTTASQVVPDEYLPPNKILFLQNIPEDYDSGTLDAIFTRFDGFREIRFVPGRRGIAFVEYSTEQEAVIAKESTSGMKLGENTLKVTYQRR